MMKSKHIFLKLFFILCALNLFSCRGAVKTDASTATGTPTPSPSAPPPDQPPDNGSGFNVKLLSSNDYSYVLHKGTGAITDNFSEECAITSLSSSTDITCIAEAKELDLYFHGVGFRYNVPQNLCEYVTVELPYFYNLQPGTGPATVIDNRLGTTTKTINTISALAGELKVGTTTKTSIYCDFDYSNIFNPAYITPNGGPNCCTGKYDLYTSSNTDAISAPSTNSWNGKASNCLLGPAMNSFQAKNSSGFPIKSIFNVITSGLNKGYNVVSPSSKNLTTNVYASNYFNSTEHVLAGGIPLAFKATAGAPATMPYHQFSCYDRAHEVKARIRLMVREWNLASEFLLDSAGDPDSTGAEAGFGNPPINDFEDFKDIGDTATSYPSDIPF